MKKLSLLMVLLLTTSVLFAQVNKTKKKFERVNRAHGVKIDPAKVPQAVKNAQAKQFSNVQKIRWRVKVIKTKEGTGKDFIASFKGKDGLVKAHYRPNGTAVLNIYHLAGDKVPANVASIAKRNYPGFDLKRGAKIEVLAKNISGYRLILTKPAAKLILYTDENGNDAKKVDEAKAAMGDGDNDFGETEGDMDEY